MGCGESKKPLYYGQLRENAVDMRLQFKTICYIDAAQNNSTNWNGSVQLRVAT